MPYAAIDIGSYETAIKIVEVNEKGVMYIEESEKIIPIGRESFLNQKIESDSIDKICETLIGYKYLMKEYGVDKYKIVATSAFRESINKHYIIEQIERKTGLNVNIISNSNEKYLMFKAAKEYMVSKFELDNKKTPQIFLNIGYGNVQVTMLTEDGMVFNQSYKIGSLRIMEVLADLERKTSNFTQVVDEYIESYIDSMPISWNKFNDGNIIVYGRELHWILEIISGNIEYECGKFLELAKQIRKKKTSLVTEYYQIDESKIELILPTLLIIDKFIKKAKTKKVYFPDISLLDGIIKEHYEQKILKLGSDAKDEDLISYVRAIGEKYHYNRKHAEYVENLSMAIFDKTKKMHGIKKDRLLLQIATILHDIGKFISSYNHYQNTANIILATDIPGISEEEKEIVALVCKYQGSRQLEREIDYQKLSDKTKLRVAKLASILNIANSLDQSHQQKIKIYDIKFGGDILVLKGKSKQETILEEWIFEERQLLFESVYGISVELTLDEKEV